MQKVIRYTYKLIFIIAGLVCLSGFNTLRGADHRVAVANFKKKITSLVNLASQYKRAFKAAGSKTAKANFFTPNLHKLAQELLKDFPADRVKSLRLSPSEQKEIIRKIFLTFIIFKKRSNNSQCDKPDKIAESIRYKLVEYCFDAFSFDDDECEEKNEVGFIVKLFLKSDSRTTRASLFLLAAMNNCLSRPSIKNCPRKEEALSFCSTRLAWVEGHRVACSPLTQAAGPDVVPAEACSPLTQAAGPDVVPAKDGVECDVGLDGVDLTDEALLSVFSDEYVPVQVDPVRKSSRKKRRTLGWTEAP